MYDISLSQTVLQGLICVTKLLLSQTSNWVYHIERENQEIFPQNFNIARVTFLRIKILKNILEKY